MELGGAVKLVIRLGEEFKAHTVIRIFLFLPHLDAAGRALMKTGNLISGNMASSHTNVLTYKNKAMFYVPGFKKRTFKHTITNLCMTDSCFKKASTEPPQTQGMFS